MLTPWSFRLVNSMVISVSYLHSHFSILSPWLFQYLISMVISVSYLHGYFSILYPEPYLYNQRVPRLPELLSSSNNLYLILYLILYLVLSSYPSHASNTSST